MPASHPALDALAVLVPPPADPRPTWGRLSWPELFERLGTPLPTDYVAFVDRYGPGNLSNWLQLRDPLQANESLAEWANTVGDQYRYHRARFPQWYPLSAWPEPGGFLACAMTDDADRIGWLITGHPEEWVVTIWPRHSHDVPKLHGAFTEVLLGWVRGEVDVDGLPADDEDETEPHAFYPWTHPTTPTPRLV